MDWLGKMPSSVPVLARLGRGGGTVPADMIELVRSASGLWDENGSWSTTEGSCGADTANAETGDGDGRLCFRGRCFCSVLGAGAGELAEDTNGLDLKVLLVEGESGLDLKLVEAGRGGGGA